MVGKVMSHLEEKFIRRWTGQQFIVGSLAIGAGGMLPLLLYIAFGPADGNPIGLGLLALAAVPIAGMGVLIGVVKLLVHYFGSRE